MTDVGRLLRPWVDEKREYAFLLGLDAADGVTFISRVGIGEEHRVVVPLDLFIGQAVALGFERIMLAHSHPSGSTVISEDDKALTKTTLEAAQMVGLTLVDHIIVTPGGKTVSLVGRRILEAAPAVITAIAAEEK